MLLLQPAVAFAYKSYDWSDLRSERAVCCGGSLLLLNVRPAMFLYPYRVRNCFTVPGEFINNLFCFQLDLDVILLRSEVAGMKEASRAHRSPRRRGFD
jgi:hypothetical protein